MVGSFATNHKMRYVSATLHRHYAYAFGPFSIFHHRRLMAVFWQPERIPVLVYPNTVQKSQQSRTAKDRIKKAQRCAFRCMRDHARTRWLAAVRVILLKCLQADVIDKMILAHTTPSARIRTYCPRMHVTRSQSCFVGQAVGTVSDGTKVRLVIYAVSKRLHSATLCSYVAAHSNALAAAAC